MSLESKEVQRKERKIKRQAESAKEAAKQKRKNRDSMVRNLRLKVPKKQKEDRNSKRRKWVEMNAIHQSIKDANKFLHRTQAPKNSHRHKTIVCIICDQFIIGTEGIWKLTKDEISPHSKRLYVKSYETFYETTLHPEVKRQYQVNVEGLHDLLLSPRSRKYNDGYATCSCCYSGMQPKMAKQEYPPKFAIANGFVIGSFPHKN
jgi:hypothetical protein